MPIATRIAATRSRLRTTASRARSPDQSHDPGRAAVAPRSARALRRSRVEIALITALIGLATGAAATAYKSRKDLEVQYDIKLREERIEAYKALWTELDRLAYYAPEKLLNYAVAHELATALRKWYFDIGGLLMSEPTRESYFDLQRALKAVGEARTGTD